MTEQSGIIFKLTREGQQNKEKIKKFLTNEKHFDIISKLSLEKNDRNLDN